MTVWKELNSTLHFQKESELLFSEFKKNGYLNKTPTEMLHLKDEVIIQFYNLLSLEREPESPIKNKNNSEWMTKSDFCFINVRATGLNNENGNFIQASKLLPCLRTNSIHLGPFTNYEFKTIYAVSSLKTIDYRLRHKGINLSIENQLKAFIEAAHMLGKTVGFDIEPHVSQFSIPVLMHPEFFRWIKLSKDKNALAEGISQDEMLSEKKQSAIHSEIHKIVKGIMHDENTSSFERDETDSPEAEENKKRVYVKVIKSLIESGYWTIPSQSWACKGVPSFKYYNHEYKYPVFEYTDESGNNFSGSAYHILTPVKFYSGIISNKPSSNAQIFTEGCDFFNNIFSYWRDHFSFDFIRYDSVDHIFDSETKGLPLSDRPTGEVLKQCIKTSKNPDKPFIGNLAERMGNEMKEYSELGFDLMLGNDMLQIADTELVKKSFDIFDRLVELNRTNDTRFSVTFAVDTHDTGNPSFWGEPLVKAAGREQMLLRHFLSRFISCGKGYRPKYESMGSQDLSYGLYESNVADKNLNWMGDKDYNTGYHFLEDIFDKYKSVILEGTVAERIINNAVCLWIIKSDSICLIPVLSFCTAKQDFLFPIEENLRITKSTEIIEYNFGKRSTSVPEPVNKFIKINGLSCNSPRLIVIKNNE